MFIRHAKSSQETSTFTKLFVRRKFGATVYMYNKLIIIQYQLVRTADLDEDPIDDVTILVALHHCQEGLDGAALKLHGFLLVVFQSSQLGGEEDDLNHYVYATGLIRGDAFL